MGGRRQGNDSTETVVPSVRVGDVLCPETGKSPWGTQGGNGLCGMFGQR